MKRSSADPRNPGREAPAKPLDSTTATSIDDAGGFSQVDLGQRLRDARREARLTLQQLSRSSGYSVTHLSQVERGQACPTIGALRRISDAIGKDIRGFLELSPLPETSIVRREERVKELREDGLVRAESATHKVPGGEIAASVLILKPLGKREVPPSSGGRGTRCFYVLKGRIEMVLEGQPRLFEAGEAVHVAPGTGLSYRNTGEEACEMLALTFGTDD